ncbi:MAG: response regulator, partial [Chrysiogenales bacterium]
MMQHADVDQGRICRSQPFFFTAIIHTSPLEGEPEPMQATQKFKVLIVEDDRWSRELMSEWVSLREELELQGLAASALEALDLMREKEASEGQGYDLILLDINLPGMSGLEFLEQVEELPFIIFTTAHEQFAVQAYEIGVLDYLLKPIEQARFDRAIDRF